MEQQHRPYKPFTVNDIPSQKGKMALVTGTGGLGFETALALARAGARVIVAGRNSNKGEEAVRRLASWAPRAEVRFELLDLASLASVAACADRLLADGSPLDLLVNNAAVMSLPSRHTTVDGFETQFGTNYLGHFALTAQLMPLLLKARSPRVVNLSSLAHRNGTIDFDDLQGERKYVPWKAYSQSKLAMLMFCCELQRRSFSNEWGLMALAAHPGYALTNIIANGPASEGTRDVKWQVSKLLAVFFSHSAAAGALPTLFAATSLLAESGGYYGPSGFYELKGAVKPSFVASQAKDEKIAARLWQVSEELSGVSWPVALEAKKA
jgi:NAD(P)-dependent dehydrogenase (short-subunit alcohol dehydrogenase family)